MTVMKHVYEYRSKHLHTCLATHTCLEKQWVRLWARELKFLVFLYMICMLGDLEHRVKGTLIFRKVVSKSDQQDIFMQCLKCLPVIPSG